MKQSLSLDFMSWVSAVDTIFFDICNRRNLAQSEIIKNANFHDIKKKCMVIQSQLLCL